MSQNVKWNAKNCEVRVGKQSVIRSKDGARSTVCINLRWFMRRKIWQNWNAHRRLTYSERRSLILN